MGSILSNRIYEELNLLNNKLDSTEKEILKKYSINTENCRILTQLSAAFLYKYLFHIGTKTVHTSVLDFIIDDNFVNFKSIPDLTRVYSINDQSKIINLEKSILKLEEILLKVILSSLQSKKILFIISNESHEETMKSFTFETDTYYLLKKEKSLSKKKAASLENKKVLEFEFFKEPFFNPYMNSTFNSKQHDFIEYSNKECDFYLDDRSLEIAKAEIIITFGQKGLKKLISKAKSLNIPIVSIIDTDGDATLCDFFTVLGFSGSLWFPIVLNFFRQAINIGKILKNRNETLDYTIIFQTQQFEPYISIMK